MSSEAGHSVLLIPVPALEPYIHGRWQHYEPTWVSRDPSFTHAHITALGPFLPSPTTSDLRRVAAVAAATPSFEFLLEQVAAFPDGIIHLVPEPAEPFTALTERLWAEFPQCPPYAGQFAGVVPHLTLDHTAPGITTETVRADLGGLLPVTARADRLELHWYGAGECRVLERWQLAGGRVSPVPRRSAAPR